MMHVTRAVITAAGRNQRSLPLQLLIDRDGAEKSVLGILIEEALSAGINEIAIIVAPGDEKPFQKAVESYRGASFSPDQANITFIPQELPLGYGHAVHCARDFTRNESFLHLVGDHLYVSGDDQTCAHQLVDVASVEGCSVSAVQPTRESLLPYFGAIGGRRVQGRKDLYLVDSVLEKPAPTEAEMRLMVPGLRAGYYLCFFGMHVLTPTVMAILGEEVERAGDEGRVTLSAALARLARAEKYLALEEKAWRYDLGVKYGILSAQLALALNGKDQAEVLTEVVELLAQRELGAAVRVGRR